MGGMGVDLRSGVCREEKRVGAGARVRWVMWGQGYRYAAAGGVVGGSVGDPIWDSRRILN